MLPTLFDKDLRDILQNPVLRRFPSLQLEKLFGQNEGLTISEGAKDIAILADMPGLDANDIEVKLENGLLQIRGEKKEEVEDDERRFYSRSSRSYRFTVDLPVSVDEAKVDAFYDKGVMHITIPKTQQAQTKKIIVRDQSKNANATSTSATSKG